MFYTILPVFSNIAANNLLVIRRDKRSQGSMEKAGMNEVNMNKIAYWHSENM
jgi:hypothetical protein